MKKSLFLELQSQYNEEIKDISKYPYPKRLRLVYVFWEAQIKNNPTKHDHVSLDNVPTKKRSRRVRKTRQIITDGDYHKHKNYITNKREKKAVIEPDSVHENTVMLESMVSHIKNNLKFEEVSDAKMILKKRLERSDLLNTQARLSIPASHLLTSFLTDDEEAYLKQKLENSNKNTKIDVKVIMNDSVYMLSLSRWNYHDKNNSSNDDNGKQVGWRYVLKNGWTRLKDDHKLQQGDIIRILSFRSNNQLHLAIIAPSKLNLLDASTSSI